MFHLGPDLTLIWKKNNRCSQSISIQHTNTRILLCHLFLGNFALLTSDARRRPRGPHRPHDTFCSFWTFCFEVDVADVTWKNMVSKRGGKIDSITHGRVGRQLQPSFTMILLYMSRFPDVCFEIQIRKKKTSAKFKPDQAFCSKLVSSEF